MNKIVYVLGAGFSAHAKIPLMSDFIDKAKDIYFADPTGKYSYFKDVFDLIRTYSFAKNVLRVNLSNIEELLSIAEMENFATNNAANSSTIEQFVKDVVSYYEQVNFSANTTPNRTSWDEAVFSNNETLNPYAQFVLSLFAATTKSGAAEHHNYQYKLFRTRPTHSYSILTFNYDMLLERIVDLINSNFETPEPLGFDRDSDSPSGIRLCKLHGSVDTQIIPPVWNKDLSTSLQTQWATAHRLLREANHIRIVGFSFPQNDGHISYLFKSALAANENLKQVDAICYDGANGEVQKRFESLFISTKSRFKGGKFEEFAALLGSGHYMDIHKQRAFTNLNLEQKHDWFMSQHS